MNPASNPRFITIEGVDGAGKSTHVSKLVEQLRDMGYDVVHTREPGGTPLGEKLREIALNEPMSPITETMLMFSSRNELLEQVIRPALAKGKIVVCDRFTDSTWAYQGGGAGVPAEILSNLEHTTHADLQPGLTLLFDLPVKISLERLAMTGKTPDKFESKSPEYFENVRNTYLARARQDTRFSIIDSSKTIEAIAGQVDEKLAKHLKKMPPPLKNLTLSRTAKI